MSKHRYTLSEIEGWTHKDFLRLTQDEARRVSRTLIDVARKRYNRLADLEESEGLVGSAYKTLQKYETLRDGGVFTTGRKSLDEYLQDITKIQSWLQRRTSRVGYARKLNQEFEDRYGQSPRDFFANIPDLDQEVFEILRSDEELDNYWDSEQEIREWIDHYNYWFDNAVDFESELIYDPYDAADIAQIIKEYIIDGRDYNAWLTHEYEEEDTSDWSKVL